MCRITELERAMRQLDQHVRELRAIQLTLLSRVATLENAAGIPEDDTPAWQREAWEEPGPDERPGFGPRPPRDGGGMSEDRYAISEDTRRAEDEFADGAHPPECGTTPPCLPGIEGMPRVTVAARQAPGIKVKLPGAAALGEDGDDG
jgi:hypothetical protein